LVFLLVEGTPSLGKELPETGVRCQQGITQAVASVIENGRRSAVNRIVFDLVEITETPNEGCIQQSVFSENVLLRGERAGRFVVSTVDILRSILCLERLHQTKYSPKVRRSSELIAPLL
jgi:hypothetical protein